MDPQRLKERILTRAYYIYLDSGCRDEKHNYYLGLQAEMELAKMESYLELKNKVSLARGAIPPSKRKVRRMISIQE